MSSGSPVVGAVGDAAETLVAEIEAAGGRPRTGDAADVVAADPDVVVTVGESATLAVARELPEMPIVPVDAGRGLRSIPADRAGAAAGPIVAGEWTVESHPLVRVESDGETLARALLDVTLVTAEAARISEFSVTDRETRVGQFRADGVVVATPAGTPGYARRVGTPIIAAETCVLAVAPIAPFATNPDHWLVADDELTLTVERDEADVELFADDRSVGSVGCQQSVTLTTDRSVRVAVLPQSQRRFP
jgi:NAD+ kinase